jgi:transposase
MNSYSEDLRKKVIERIESGERITEVSKIFKLSRTTIYKWKKMKEDTSSLKDKKINGCSKKINLNKFEKYINENPDLRLKEYAKEFKVSNVAIFKAMKKINITRKKK